MIAAAFIIPALIVAGILVYAGIRLFKGRRYSAGEGLQLLGQVPANPSLPGTAYLFPGRGTPPDPDVRKTATTLVDKRPKTALPDGLRESEKPPERG